MENLEPHSRFYRAARRTVATFLATAPILLGVLGLSTLITAAVPAKRLAELLPMEGVFGPPIGAVVGGLSAGHPVTSYVLANEFVAAGMSLATVTAFIVSWVTLGIIHIPAEAAMLGLRFALWRSALSLVFAVVTGELISATVTIFR